MVTQVHPHPESELEESRTELREREAERLWVPEPKPGDDPPTYGDEGGGTLYPEGFLKERPERRRMSFLRRILVSEIWPWRLPGERA